MDYQTYQKIRTHCWQYLAVYIDTPANNEELDFRVFIGNGGISELNHEIKIADGLFHCKDLTLLENAAAHLLFVVSNHRAHTWQREPCPPNGREPAPPLEQWQSEELANQTREAVSEFADLLPPGEAASLIKACNRISLAQGPLPVPTIGMTKPANNCKEIERFERDYLQAADPASAAPPGGVPKTSVGKLSVKAAWKIERKGNRRATDREVMDRLQQWADNGDEPAILKKSDRGNRCVVWMTTGYKEKNYTLEACQRTLAVWNKSRE